MSSLFGQSKSTPSSLFGNPIPATSAQSQTVPTSNLFNSISQPQQQTNSASSLFGGAQKHATTLQPAALSIFPSQPQQQSNLSEQAIQGQQQQRVGQQSQAEQLTSQPCYFDNLLEKGKKRTHDYDGGPGFRDLPSLQLGLGDIARQVRALGSLSTKSQRGRAVDAHYLLAASGINPGMTRRDLDSLAVQLPTSGALNPPQQWDPDTYKYVEQLQQQSTLRMISEGLERAQRNFDAYLVENVNINWELQRTKICEHFGLAPKHREASDELASSSGVKGSFGKSTRRARTSNLKMPEQSTFSRSIFGQSSIQKSVIGTPGGGSGNGILFADIAERNAPAPAVQDDRFMREKQRKFAEKVQMLNRARLDKISYPVLQEFKSVESQSGGEVSTPAFHSGALN